MKGNKQVHKLSKVNIKLAPVNRQDIIKPLLPPNVKACSYFTTKHEIKKIYHF
jgi:hypothetical protein